MPKIETIGPGGTSTADLAVDGALAEHLPTVT